MLIERDYMKRDTNAPDRSRRATSSDLDRLLKPVKRQRLYGTHIVCIAFMFGMAAGMVLAIYLQRFA